MHYHASLHAACSQHNSTGSLKTVILTSLHLRRWVMLALHSYSISCRSLRCAPTHLTASMDSSTINTRISAQHCGSMYLIWELVTTLRMTLRNILISTQNARAQRTLIVRASAHPCVCGNTSWFRWSIVHISGLGEWNCQGAPWDIIWWENH